jgi:hypothetical protein
MLEQFEPHYSYGASGWRRREQEAATREVEQFRDVLWRFNPVEVAERIILPAADPIKGKSSFTSVPFLLKSENLPFNGVVSQNILSKLQVHVRSRYAHLGVDVLLDTGVQLAEELKEKGVPTEEKGIPVNITIVNHTARPITLPKGEKPFHFFYVPESAYVKGKELEEIVGNTPEKLVRIAGSPRRQWNIDYQTTPSGKRQAEGIFLRIDPKERVWITPSTVSIEFPDYVGTFQHAREYLSRAFRPIHDSQDPMPANGLWIGRGPFLMLADGVYAKIDHDAYLQRGSEFFPVGMQTHSPLLEGLRTQHFPHFELKGDADWVRVTIIRSDQEAKAG